MVIALIVIGGTSAQAYSSANFDISSLNGSTLLDKLNFPPAPSSGFIYILGGGATTGALKDVWTSTSTEIYKNHWKQLTNNPAWGQPTTAVPIGVYFKNELWIVTGETSGPSQVSHSANGVTWTNTPTPPWSKRNEQGLVVFNDGTGDAMWMVGGIDGANRYGDVWKTYDGINWTLVTPTTPWSAIYSNSRSLIAFNGELWFIAGNPTPSTPTSSVWHSSNGINWAQSVAIAPFGPRGLQSQVVFDNKMWIIGGQSQGGNQNDVWYSSDGTNWIQATAHAQWAGRRFHSSVVFDNKMWVLGGIVGFGVVNDAWYSSDGVNWFPTSPLQMPWVARAMHTVIVRP